MKCKSCLKNSLQNMRGLWISASSWKSHLRKNVTKKNYVFCSFSAQVQNWSKAILRRGFNQETCQRCLDVILYSHHSFFRKSLLWIIQIWGKEAGEHIKGLHMSIHLLLKLQILPATHRTLRDCNKILNQDWINNHFC